MRQAGERSSRSGSSRGQRRLAAAGRSVAPRRRSPGVPADPGLRPRAGIGSSTSHRITAINCARHGRDLSTPWPRPYDKYKAIRPAYVFSVVNARPEAARTETTAVHEVLGRLHEQLCEESGQVIAAALKAAVTAAPGPVRSCDQWCRVRAGKGLWAGRAPRGVRRAVMPPAGAAQPAGSLSEGTPHRR